MSGSVIDIKDVVDGLAARIEPLCRELFPAGVKEGHEFRVGSLAGEKGRSMAVNLGARAGVWSDFAAGRSGDALDLVAGALFGGDKKKAFQWAKRWLGLEDSSIGASAARPDFAEIERRRKVAEAAKARQAREDENKRDLIRRLWDSCRPEISATPVDDYLMGRGIDLRALGRPPRALRFHPALKEPEQGRRFPAMVAAVAGPDGTLAAVHRTFLMGRPGSVTKAPMNDPKMSLGRLAGGCIPIWRGNSGEPLRRAHPGEAVVLTEGIEDALTVALACPGRRVLCAVSLANMARVWLPAAIKTVVIHAHNEDGPEAEAALLKAVRFHAAQGREVRIARAPGGAKDFNDVVKTA
jgi:hypothetical protein